MNKKLKFALLRRSNEQGFALPVAVGLGLVMILVGTTMLVRAQSDLAIALVQRNTAQSLSLSEVSVTRIQSAFKQTPSLATTAYDSGNNTNGWIALLGGVGSSQVTSLLKNIDPNNWITLPGFGDFKIIKYQPDVPVAGVGTLDVSGRTPQGAISYLSVQVSTNGLGIAEWERKEVAP